VRFSKQDESRYDYWRRMEFTAAQWQSLAEHAGERGLLFLSSPFSVEAAEILRQVGVPMWKIASGQVSDAPLFDWLLDNGRPFLLSTGMSALSEIDAAVGRIRGRGLECTVLQCTSAYPTPPEKVGLNLIPFFRARYNCPVGLSDHSGTIYPGLAAATLGIAALEVHVTLSRDMFGPDVPASLTPAELRQLVEGVRYIETMQAHPVDKDALARDLQPVRDLFTKSVVARASLPAGTVLAAEHLAAKKPGTGIPAAHLSQLVGRKLRRAVQADQLLAEADLEPQ
jgi:N-acetylneuraminate synthase